MKNIIIADAGSTKTDWAILNTQTGKARKFRTDGINALISPPEEMSRLFAQASSLAGDDISEIYYYGAGCATPAICRRTEAALSAAFGGIEAYATTDLLGAARALLGNKRGIACILGTGSNSCLYDGMTIIEQIPSLGFILGDEGSGAALGKRLVSDAFKGHLPEIIKEKFLDSYKLTLADILDKVYKKPGANAFLASLVPFLSDNLWNPYIYSLVLKELTKFMVRNVRLYKDVHSLPVCFTGSIAANFEKLVREAASSQGLSVGTITQVPIDGLINFHNEVI